MDVRQLGDDGVYRWVKTSVIFLKNEENDDVIEITLSRPITAEKSRELDNLRLRSILEMVMLSKYEYVSLVDIKTGRYTLYADSDRKALSIPPSGDYVKWNDIICDTYVSPSDRSEYLENTKLENLTAMIKENSGNYSTRIRLGDTPERRWREVMYQLCTTGEDEMLMTVRDIHDEVTAAEMRKESEQRQILQGLGSDAPIGIITCDIGGNITYANGKSAAILGSPSIDETMKINLLTFPILIVCGFSGKLEECLKENKSIVSEISYTSKWGKKVYLRVHVKSFVENRKIIGAQVIIDDISELKHLEEELRKTSITDFLTNAYNRRYFISQLENEIERTKRQESVFSLIMFDLDHFKKVNDVYGHHAGDIILQSVADVVKKSIRKIDCLARWGGEEFILLIPGNTATQAVILAERLRKKIEEMDVQEACRVTASFGITQYVDSDTADTMIQKADELTYLAKARGRNQVAV
jgi:diguanylate cyclase (GGDEF)-like protein/PAS domain S-box-containing protein